MSKHKKKGKQVLARKPERVYKQYFFGSENIREGALFVRDFCFPGQRAINHIGVHPSKQK